MKNLILIYFSGADDDHLKEKPQSFLLTTPDMSSLSEKEQTDFLQQVSWPYSGWTAGTCSAHWIDEIKPEHREVHFALDQFIKYVCAEFGIEDTRYWWQYPHMEDAQDMFDVHLPLEIKNNEISIFLQNISNVRYDIRIQVKDSNIGVMSTDMDGIITSFASSDFHLLTKVIACYARACKKIG